MNQINQLEASFNEIQSMYEAGELDKDQYVNLLQGLAVEEALTLNAEELQRKEELHKYVSAAITAASLIA
jgi:uncharacterized protein YqgQ